MTKKNGKVLTNPIIKTLVDCEADGAILVGGFVGPADDSNMVRVYPDFSMASYVDLPEDKVLHIEDSKNPKKPSTIFLDPSAKFVYTAKNTTAQASVTVKIDMSVNELKRVIASASTSSCGCSQPEVRRSALRVDDQPDGPERPPQDCELGCLYGVNGYFFCLDTSDPEYQWWCWIEYYLCYFTCKWTPRGGQGGGIVIA